MLVAAFSKRDYCHVLHFTYVIFAPHIVEVCASMWCEGEPWSSTATIFKSGPKWSLLGQK